MDHELERKWKTEDAAENLRKINRKVVAVYEKDLLFSKHYFWNLLYWFGMKCGWFL